MESLGNVSRFVTIYGVWIYYSITKKLSLVKEYLDLIFVASDINQLAAYFDKVYFCSKVWKSRIKNVTFEISLILMIFVV